MNDPPADWPNANKGSRVRAGGIDWYVQSAGEGPVLLLLHGTGAATHSWRDVLPHAAQHFRVIAPDLPGHGFTKGRSTGGLSMPAIARAVGALCAEIGVSPALIAGHSAGAAIALRMGLDGLVQPKGVVALAPALLPFPGIAQQLFPTMAKLMFVNPLAPHLFAGVARQSGAVERFLLRSTGSRIDAAGLKAYARLFGDAGHCAGVLAMMADWDLVPLKRDLPRVAAPVLVMHGTKDAAIPVSAAREAAALIPNASVEIIDGLGHLLHEERPAETVACIRAFAHHIAVQEGETA